MIARYPTLAILMLAVCRGLFPVCLAASPGLPAGYEPTLSARVGSLGIGPEISIRIPQSHWGFRGNVNGFAYNDSDLYHHAFHDANPIGGYDLNARFGGTARLLNGGLTTDFYPLGTGFRLSVGVYGNGDRITARAVPEGSARIGPHIYDIQDAGTVSMKALPNRVAPYFGFGYAGRAFGNIVLSVDAGILAEGTPRVTMTTQGPAATLPAFTNEVARERQRIAHDIDVPVYPVIEFGVGYRF